MEKFLITGGQGFLGAWIARELLREGAPFVLLDLETSDHILEQVLEPDVLPRLERVFGDVADPRFLERVISESEVTRIIHLAGLQVPTCRADPLRGARVNVLGTLGVFEAARANRERVRSVVYASSAAVAGPGEDYVEPIADSHHHLPRTHYGVFKLANEGNARVYWLDHGIPSVGLRPLSIYGVGREIGITSGPTLAIRAAVAGESYTVPFTGTTGFNYVEDVAAAFVACARGQREGALALNQPGENHTIDEFLRTIEEEIPEARGKLRSEGAPIPVAYDFLEEGLRGVVGDVPHTSIREGIRRTARRFRELRERGLLRPLR